ncbi:hypothetical protein WR25_19008 [Diploscapter pachys]|uniref:Uncharacterized protein n=1 Tax=Diploscapter pachys TaxID=2018661 RepID=A0A2A2KG40_9BILA|nr:hypothetical protein WR25_19008 [Diploscapter pachys]
MLLVSSELSEIALSDSELRWSCKTLLIFKNRSFSNLLIDNPSASDLVRWQVSGLGLLSSVAILGGHHFVSDCTEVLLEAFFTECKTDEDLPEARWQARIEDSICIQQRVLITLANASHDLREKLGENNIIDKVVELGSESTSVNITANCRLLSSMTQAKNQF